MRHLALGEGRKAVQRRGTETQRTNRGEEAGKKVVERMSTHFMGEKSEEEKEKGRRKENLKYQISDLQTERNQVARSLRKVAV